jgi:hypothetical protein
MRGNGLFAASYTAVAELDPPVADALLEVLREAGVAAYAEPSQGRRGPYLDVQMAGAPREQLYVDRARAEDARAIVSDRLPALRGMFDTEQHMRAEVTPAASEDAAWSALVARFHEPAADPVPRWPVIEDAEAEEPLGQTQDSASHPAPAPGAVEVAAARADPDEHFVPPQPPPLPRLDPVSRIAWAALIGGPALLVLAALSGQLLPHFLVGCAVVAFVAGFLTLVVRMKDRPGDEEGSDGGAVL